MSEPLIQFNDLSLSLGGSQILNGINTTVQRGGFTSLIGPNGAGKSSLLKCLTRIHAHFRGEIILAGRTLTRYSQRELARLMSYVPQLSQVPAAFTVFELAAMGRYPYKRAFSGIGTHDRQVIEKVLDQAGLTELADRKLNGLSGGERQKALIAAALAQEPEILVLDEPLTFLDPKHQTAITSMLRTLQREAGITILAVTHDLISAVLESDRILAMRNGAIIFEGEAHELAAHDHLDRVFETDFDRIHHPATGKIIPLQRSYACTQLPGNAAAC